MKLPCVFNSYTDLENHKHYECVSWCICVISGAEFKPFRIFSITSSHFVVRINSLRFDPIDL